MQNSHEKYPFTTIKLSQKSINIENHRLAFIGSIFLLSGLVFLIFHVQFLSQLLVFVSGLFFISFVRIKRIADGFDKV
jgi:hypothetical protein